MCKHFEEAMQETQQTAPAPQDNPAVEIEEGDGGSVIAPNQFGVKADKSVLAETLSSEERAAHGAGVVAAAANGLAAGKSVIVMVFHENAEDPDKGTVEIVGDATIEQMARAALHLRASTVSLFMRSLSGDMLGAPGESTSVG